jgi:hypothetical protein
MTCVLKGPIKLTETFRGELKQYVKGFQVSRMGLKDLISKFKYRTFNRTWPWDFN